MKQVLDALEAIHTTSIEGVAPFLHPYHEPWKLHYSIGSRSLWIWAERDNPLIIVNEESIRLWNTDFRFPKWEIDISNHHIHYSLCHIIWRLWKVRLNHMWMCVNVDNIDDTVQQVIEAHRWSIHKVFEDPAWRDEGMRWLFIGNPENDDPLFEIVLPDKILNMRNHFQVDIDTILTQRKIKKCLEKSYWRDFFDWKLRIPQVWIVLWMWTTQTCWHYEIRLWIGNNRRNPRAHRETLKPLS